MALCIIGAGTSGLCVAQRAVQNNVIPIIFEQTAKLSGTWIYQKDIANVKRWNEIHTSMYEDLRTNLPKEIMGFPHFSIGACEESYITSEGILHFLEEYAEHFNLRKYLKLLHQVIRVTPKNNQWQVVVKNLRNKNIDVYTFNNVVICSGHYHTPLYPNIKGSDIFIGHQIHSHDFRSCKNFQAKCILVIGAGPSGMDLCHKISKVALLVYLSHRMVDMPKSKFLKNVINKGNIVKFNAHGAFFNDNSYEYIDYILYCTGFKFIFPFLSMDCKIFVKENYIRALHKHCINTYYPTMSFVGIPFYVCTSQMVDLQTRFIIKYITTNKKLPSQGSMQFDTKQEMIKRWQMGYRKHHAHIMGPLQNGYFMELSETAVINGVPQVYTNIHNESSQQFLDDIINFREEEFKIIDDITFIRSY